MFTVLVLPGLNHTSSFLDWTLARKDQETHMVQIILFQDKNVPMSKALDKYGQASSKWMLQSFVCTVFIKAV